MLRAPRVTAEGAEQQLHVYIIRAVKCNCVKYDVWGCFFFPATVWINCFCNKYGESGLSCVMWYCVFLPWSLVFISVGSQSRQNHTRAEEFHTSFTVFCLLLSVLLCRHRVQDLLPCGQQGPTALDHGRGGLQRPTVHRHGSFCWADLRVQTHRSHGCGLGWATGSSGCYHRAERSVWYYIIIVSQL